MPIRTVSREVFVPAPRPGVSAHGANTFTRPAGGDLISIHGYESKDDLMDVAYIRHSSDHGRTWSPAREWPTCERRSEGTLRRWPVLGHVDGPTGRYVWTWMEGVLPNDTAHDRMLHFGEHYGVSEDGGLTDRVSEPIIHEGHEYDVRHPLPGVWLGRNGYMYVGTATLTLPDGTLCVPIQIFPLAPDGTLYNPGGGWTYSVAAVLLGRWKADGRIAWRMSQCVEGDPERTTRGLVEPTVAPLADGRLLMVMRGSNHTKPHLPGYKWHAFSSDGGFTWTAPLPWTYDDGTPFFSPSSISRLYEHPGGPLFWVGNITPANPDSNLPRQPLIIGEVDRETGLLLRQSVSVIDDRGPGDSDQIQLSNFFIRDDRETGGMVLFMNRLYERTNPDGTPDATAAALQYKLALDAGG